MGRHKAVVNVSASLLPEDFKTSVGSSMVYNLNDGAGDNCKWVQYGANIGTSSEVIIQTGVAYLAGDTGSVTGSVVEADDKIEFVLLKHSGFLADGVTKTTNKIYFNWDHGVAAAAATGNLILEAGDVWAAKLAGTPDCEDLTAIAATAGVKLLVYAVLDDDS